MHKARGITFHNFKLDNKAVVMKPCGIGEKRRMKQNEELRIKCMYVWLINLW